MKRPGPIYGPLILLILGISLTAVALWITVSPAPADQRPAYAPSVIPDRTGATSYLTVEPR